jgi:GntR family transcriptional regulator
MRGGSFSQKMKELGLPYESRNILARPIHYNPLIFEQLNAQKGDKVWEIARLRIICHEPAAIHTSYLPEKEFPALPKDAGSITSVFEYFEKTGHEGHKGEGARLCVSNLNSTERKLLGVAGYAPGLTYSARRIAADGKTILELLRTVYRADRFTFLL